MKPTTDSILKQLNSKPLNDQLALFKQTNPTYSFNEMTVEEMYNQFDSGKQLLLKAIEQNILDEQLTFTKRNQILQLLKNLTSHLQQIAPHKYLATHPNSVAFAQAIMNGVIGLSEAIDNAKIEERLKGFSDYEKELKELTKARKTYINLINDIEKATETNKESQEISKSIKAISEDIVKTNKELESEKNKALKVKGEIDETSEKVKSQFQDIEDKKLKITSFHTNIEEYKKSIDKLEADAKVIIAKEETINNLIDQAEKALNLKSAEGISAAFSSHYSATNEKWTLKWWMVGASFFIASAIALTIWIVIGDHADSISSIIGRIVAVGIAITGATFCAKQYVKQKNILEDYAYKSVLAKSIVAFTEEIKKRDDKKVAEYLSKVLDEIHKDPLRSRDNHEDKDIGINAPEMIKKLVDILSKDKK